MTLLTRPSRLLLLKALVALSQPLASSVDADAVSIEATVEGTISGQHQSEHLGPASSGALVAARQWSGGTNLLGNGAAEARAAVNDAGRAATTADAVPTSPSSSDFQQSVTRWSHTVTNTTMQPARFFYSIVIQDLTLEVVRPNPSPSASGYAVYELLVRADGQRIFASAANLDAGDLQLSPTGTALTATFFSNGQNHRGVRFAPFSALVPLAVLLPGESTTVDVRAEVQALIGSAGVGAKAVWGDAGDLEHPGVISAVIPETAISTNAASWAEIKGAYR